MAVVVTEKCWQKSERVLVYEESGCSRSAVAAIAYLMQKNNLKTKVSVFFLTPKIISA